MQKEENHQVQITNTTFQVFPPKSLKMFSIYGTFQKKIYIRNEAVEHKPFQLLLDSV